MGQSVKQLPEEQRNLLNRYYRKTMGEVASKAVLQAENKDSKNSSYRGEDYSTGTGLTDVGVLDLPGSEDCCGDISCSEDPLSCLQCISLPFRLCLICLG